MARINGSGFKMKSSPTKGLFSNFFKGIKAKKTGDVGEKLKSKYSGEAQRADKVAKPGESKYQFDVRTRKPKSKVESNTTGNLDNMFKPSVFSPTAGTDRINKTLDLKKTKSGLYDPTKSTNTPKTPESTNTPKTPKTKFSGSGTDARKKQYDAKGWRYDETIKGHNRDGGRKKFVVQTNVTENKKGTLTPNTKSFNSSEEQNAFIADNKGSFGYKIDDEGNRIEKKKDNKTKISDPVPNVAANKTEKKDTNLLAQFLKPGFMHAADLMGNPVNKKSPYKKGLGKYAKKAKGSRGYKMNRK